MTSPFDAIDADLSADMLAAFGETCQIFPRSTGTYSAPGTDSDRQPTIALVILSDSPGLEWMSGTRRGSELTGGTRLQVGEAEVWMGRAQAKELGFKLQKGDKISFPARNQDYSVTNVHVTDMGDVRAMIVREGNT